ncbi:MAG: zinc-dependent metalloprotease [Acidimicrobiales bacterium]
MSDSEPFGTGDDPFKGMPFLGDLSRMIKQQGPISWDAARQLAHSIATGATSEPNVDPMERIRFEQLARVADLQVAHATGLTPSVGGRGVNVVPVTRTQWVATTLDAYRPLFERLAGSLGMGAAEPSAEVDPFEDPMGDPTAAWLGNVMQFLSPMMMGMAAGSMIGHLSARSFGQYDLPIPRPPGDDLLVLVPTIDEFGNEWSLAADDLRLWVCLHEVTHHAVLGVPHVRARLESLIGDYVAGFHTDPHALENRLGDIDPSTMSDIAGIQQLFSDPEVLLGAMRSPAQEELLPRLDALVTVIVGYVDHVMDRMGSSLVPTYERVTEAIRRRRVEATESDRYVEQLFGLHLSQDRYDRGAAFIEGVTERAGESELERLWRSERELPTPAELDAPGLWLARIDLPG